MLRHFKTLTLRAGLILLILLASVPEVRCCCDVSWGPAGINGNSALCCAISNPQPHADCCCSPEREEGVPPADGCKGEDCDGCLTVIYPAPMAAGPNMESVATPFAEAWSLASSATIVAPPLAASGLVETPDSVLMPAQRCALFQTWLV
ncbi:MAG: hypothetical protein IAF94_10825 [Pirellulaceae bacterium]|nr:hypothetical protein [Pirellulaceae bacterium]